MKAAPVALAAAGVLALGGFAAGVGTSVAGEDTVTTFAAPSLAAGEVQGVCTTFLPPNVDPCDAVNGALRYGFFGAIVNSTYHPKWSVANPGEVQRLAALMATPRCSSGSTGQPQTMRTFYGAALGAVVDAIACSRHPEPIVMPAPNPKPTGTGDRQSPTPPGPITVTPGP